MTSQMVSLDIVVGIFEFRGVNVPKVKFFGRCRDLERKCKMLIQGVGRGDFLGVLDVKNRGAFGGGGVMGSKIQNI